MFREHEPNFIERAVIAVETIAASLEQIADSLIAIENSAEQARHSTAE